MSSSSPNLPAESSETDHRAAFIAGLRDLATWLETTPAAPVSPYLHPQLPMPLHTNEAVSQTAAALGLDVATDDEGNTSCDVAFGPVVWHMYGYADFKQHVEQATERRARQWADRNGLEIRPATSDGGAR